MIQNIKLPKFSTIFNEFNSLYKLSESFKGIHIFINSKYFEFVKHCLSTIEYKDENKIPQVHIENEKKKLNNH